MEAIFSRLQLWPRNLETCLTDPQQIWEHVLNALTLEAQHI